MRFEFDSAKSAANRVKHGIDFVDAQEIWTDRDRIEIPARSLDEPRYQVIGRIGRNDLVRFCEHIAMKRSASSRSVARAPKKRRATSPNEPLSARQLDEMHR